MNQKFKKILLVFFILLTVVGAWVVINQVRPKTVPANTGFTPSANTPAQTTPPAQTPPADTTTKTRATILINVPFTSQAPLGQWSDPVYQNACEEASILMAHLLIENIPSITKDEATKEIKDIADFEYKTFGTFYDLSTPDTAKLMEDYYGYKNIEVKTDITADDIIQELESGNIVIVPANGQLLGNPYYTPPGPLEHKILIKGYDFATDEFITNDCGTRHGENYRYKKQVLYDAIREYPTGYKEPITSIQKVMMVIKKAQ